MFSDDEDEGGLDYFLENDIFSDEEFSDDYDLETYFGDDAHGSASIVVDSQVENLIDTLQMTDMVFTNAEENCLVLEEGLWGSLPEELLDKILTWLTPAAHFRFRCVSKRWKSLLSSPGWLLQYAQVQSRPSCTIMCTLGARKASFFCHSERRWFDIPHNPVSYPELGWELAVVDAGLVCYQCNWSGGLWLCICNPLTQSCKVLPPNYPHRDMHPSHCELLKLLVDRQTSTFKVVVLVHSSNPPTTVVYDSTTSLWTVCRSFPAQDFRSDSFFVWKNVIYSQCFQPGILLAFGIDSGVWSEVKTDLPSECIRRHFIISSHDRVLLIQIKSISEEPISIWTLLDDGSSSSRFSRSKWAKISVDMPIHLKRLVSDIYSCVGQSDAIVFTTSHTNQWVTYKFATKSWHVMPTWGRRNAAYSWFEWEPRLDMDVEADHLYCNGPRT